LPLFNIGQIYKFIFVIYACCVYDVHVGYLCLQITSFCQHSFLIWTLMKTWILCQFLQWTDLPKKGDFSFTKLDW